MFFRTRTIRFSSSIQEELEFGLKNQGLDETERNERIRKVLDIVKLDKPLTTHPLNLGRGNGSGWR